MTGTAWAVSSASDSGCGTWIVIGLVAFGIWRCSSGGTDPGNGGASFSPSAEYGSGRFASSDELADMRADAEAHAVADLAYSSYQTESYAYGCTDDCSGHEAGWQWAAENEISDPGDCGGNSLSFEEGCMAFGEAVRERADQAVGDHE